jgi:hypothetical protein
MRQSFVFMVVWIFVVIYQSAFLFHSLSQYRIAKGLEALYATRPPVTEEDKAQLESIVERKGHLFDTSVDGGVELVLIGALCFLHFIKWPVRERSKTEAAVKSPAKA